MTLEEALKKIVTISAHKRALNFMSLPVNVALTFILPIMAKS